jgi:hypothetical protein
MALKLVLALLFVAGVSPAANFDTPLEMSKAPTWRERQQALHVVLQKYKFSDPDVHTGIVQLFNRETDDPKWQDEAENDDAFNGYYEELSQLCKLVAQSYHQEDAWRSLVFAVYNPTSQYGQWLVTQPEAFPLFLEMSKSTNNLAWAGQGLQMLGLVLQFCHGSSTPYCLEVAKQKNEILSTLRKVAVSDLDDVASAAILALGTCGDSTDIQLLEQRAAVLQKKVIDPANTLAINTRFALVRLIQLSNEQIRKRLAAQQGH